MLRKEKPPKKKYRLDTAANINDQIFGLWGDENGDDDGSEAMIGESSIATATLCFGDSMTGNNGHSDLDVLYIAFKGTDAVPGADGANWAATSADEFESSLETLGAKLLQRIGGGGSSNSTTGGGVGSTPSVISSLSPTVTVASASSTSTSGSSGSGDDSCSWSGHCSGEMNALLSSKTSLLYYHVVDSGLMLNTHYL